MGDVVRELRELRKIQDSAKVERYERLMEDWRAAIRSIDSARACLEEFVALHPEYRERAEAEIADAGSP